MKPLNLGNQVCRQLEALVTEGYPDETCGLLVGNENDTQVEVVEAVKTRNLNRVRAKDRFELDPGDFVKVDHAARERGLSIVGIWHSHPDHPARPSETDRQAAWGGWSYLILSVNGKGVDELRSWRLVEQRFSEETILS